MLLAIDIGNSATKLGLFEGGTLVAKHTFETRRADSAADIYEKTRSALTVQLEGIVISSVVNEVNDAVREFGTRYFGTEPVFVDHTFDFGFDIKYYPKSDCGSDRLVDSYEAVRKFGTPCIVCDFGTATTIDYVNESREYLGGIITPGINTLASALYEKTSKLPRVELERPEPVIGNSTVGSIQSGIYYGYIGLVDGIIERMTAGGNPVVVSTGGFADLIAEESRFVKIIEPDLMLEGLKGIFESINRS